MSLLDGTLLKTIQWAGALFNQRRALNFIGSGVIVTDNPSNNSTDVSISSGAPVPVYFAALSTLAPSATHQWQYIDGYSSVADGGEGSFQWVATSTLTPNGGTIVAVTGISTGRWIRKGALNSPQNPCWYGADKTGNSDSYAAFVACEAATQVLGAPNNAGGVIDIPQGIYKMSAAWTVGTQGHAVKIVGHGAASLANGVYGQYVQTLGGSLSVFRATVLWFYNNTDGVVGNTNNEILNIEDVYILGTTGAPLALCTSGFTNPNVGSTVTTTWSNLPTGLSVNQLVYVSCVGQMQITGGTGVGGGGTGTLILENTGYVETTTIAPYGYGLVNEAPGTVVPANAAGLGLTLTRGLSSSWDTGSGNGCVIHATRVQVSNFFLGVDTRYAEDCRFRDIRVNGCHYNIIVGGNENSFLGILSELGAVGARVFGATTVRFPFSLLQGNILAHVRIAGGSGAGIDVECPHMESSYSGCVNVQFDCWSGVPIVGTTLRALHIGGNTTVGVLPSMSYFPSGLPGTFSATNGSPTITTSQSMVPYFNPTHTILAIGGGNYTVETVSAGSFTVSPNFGGATGAVTPTLVDEVTKVALLSVTGTVQSTFPTQIDELTILDGPDPSVPVIPNSGSRSLVLTATAIATGKNENGTSGALSVLDPGSFIRFGGVQLYTSYNWPGFDLTPSQQQSIVWAAGRKVLCSNYGGNYPFSHWDIQSGGVLGLPSFLIRNTTLSAGQVVLPSVPTGDAFVVTVGGTTGNGEPAWSHSGTTTDGGVSYTRLLTYPAAVVYPVGWHDNVSSQSLLNGTNTGLPWNARTMRLSPGTTGSTIQSFSGLGGGVLIPGQRLDIELQPTASPQALTIKNNFSSTVPNLPILTLTGADVTFTPAANATTVLRFRTDGISVYQQA